VRKLASVLILGFATCCAAETLRDGLHQAGIPQTGFTSAELSQEINSTSAVQGTDTYFVYMRAVGNALTGEPQIVRYDSATGKVARQALQAGDPEQCCGSPLDIEFTKSYLLLSFHYNPSADTTLVVDRELRLIEILFGFEFEELAPDQVVFIENMIHFATQQPERLMFVDLPTGHLEEVYPPQGDVLRDAFTRQDEQHMPTQSECIKSNDPCNPKIFDETIEFLHAAVDEFTFDVTRDAAHPGASESAQDEMPSQTAVYKYRRTAGQWRYCEVEWQAPQAVPGRRRPSPLATDAICNPTLPVVADTSGLLSPFPAIIRKVK
jgi:hypothetical protein